MKITFFFLFFVVVLIGLIFGVYDKRKAMVPAAILAGSSKQSSNFLVDDLSKKNADSFDISLPTPKYTANHVWQEEALEFDVVGSKAAMLIAQGESESMNVIELVEPEPSRPVRLLDPSTDFSSLELEMLSSYQSRESLVHYAITGVKCVSEHCEMYFSLGDSSRTQQLLVDVVMSNVEKEMVEVQLVGTTGDGITALRLMH